MIDALGTCEAYLVSRMEEARVVSVTLESRRPIGERLGLSLSTAVERGIERLLERLDAGRWERR